MTEQTIRSIILIEPRTSPTTFHYTVGMEVCFYGDIEPGEKHDVRRLRSVRVKAITFEVENRGDHGIGLFTIYGPEASVVARVNERAVAETHYEIPS